MRNTPWTLWLGRKAQRVVLAGGLGFCGWGCHEHYYYYGNPTGTAAGCPPGSSVMPSTVTTAGPLCEVPGDATTAGSSSQRSTTVSDGRNSRLVVSTPSNNSLSRFGWKPSDPDSPPAITQVEGGLQSSTIKQ
jgi:hypothetical protein